MFSGATVYEMLAWHHIRLRHSGKMNILSRNEQSPVLIRALPPDTSASLLQDKNSMLTSVLVALTRSGPMNPRLT